MTERSHDTAVSCECLPHTMSIHARKITDACRDKDCIEDLRVYLTQSSQSTLDSASSVRVRCADLLFADIDVEPVAFDRHHYCVDVTFYYRILADAVVGTCRPTTLCGMASFSKRAVLCGEDSRAHVFTSQGNPCAAECPANRPVAVVEVLDPMVLTSKVREGCDCSVGELAAQIPQQVKGMFDEELCTLSDHRRLYVTLGQFSIIRLERETQIVVEVLDYAIPSKECTETPGCCAEDPCEMFSRIPFPIRQFVTSDCDSHQMADHYTTEASCSES